MQTVTAEALGCETFKPANISRMILAMQAHYYRIDVPVYIVRISVKAMVINICCYSVSV